MEQVSAGKAIDGKGKKNEQKKHKAGGVGVGSQAGDKCQDPHEFEARARAELVD